MNAEAKSISDAGANTAGHTLTPWETVGSCIRDARTSEGGGFMVADCGGLICFREEAVCIANAAHIVRCVNTHDNLLAALRDTLTHLRAAMTWVDHSPDPDWEDAMRVFQAAATRASAAIVFAEGRNG